MRIFFIAFSIFIITGFTIVSHTNEEDSLEYVQSIIPLTETLDNEDPVVLEDMEFIAHGREMEIIENEDISPKGYWVWATVTAYEPSSVSCGKYADGKTSTGVNVHSTDPQKAYGYAADPRMIPYGTSIYVPQYWEILQKNRNPNFRPSEPLIVDDTGGIMRRSGDKGIIHIDVRFRTIAACKKWGVRRMKIFIYE